MNTKLVSLGLMAVVLMAGYAMAQEEAAPVAVEEIAVPAVKEVGNTICPLTGRTLNLADANDFTSLEVEGLKFNVCPMAKADYTADPAKYADKVAQAVAGAAAPVAEEAAPVAEAVAPAAAY